MTRVMVPGIPNEFVWPGIVGSGAFVLSLASPFLNRWHIRRHAARLEARGHRGYDRYYEELRELEAYPPEGHTAFDAQTVGAAALLAIWFGVATYTIQSDNDDARALFEVLLAGLAFSAALVNALREWRARRGDPRTRPVFADRFTVEERAERWKLKARLVGSILLAAGLLAVTLWSSSRALEHFL